MTLRLTKEQAIIVSGYTGFLCCNFSDLHADIEKRLDRPVWTHELGSEHMRKLVKDKYRDDFLSLVPADSQPPMPPEGEK